MTIKKFDQEIFGIHEALSANGLVFCSTTLTQRFVKANLLQEFKTKAVQSKLCYYIPNKEDLKIEMPENLSNGWKVYSINKPISLIGFNYTTLKLI